MGLDSRLIRDRTYIIAQADGALAECGGWSFPSTLAGKPLYLACGYLPIERIRSRPIDGVTVSLIRMGKQL